MVNKATCVNGSDSLDFRLTWFKHGFTFYIIDFNDMRWDHTALAQVGNRGLSCFSMFYLFT